MKPTSTFLILLVAFIAQSTCQRFIQPTYRPPPRRPVIIRTARETGEPQWLYQGDIAGAPATGDHPYLPQYIDDVKIDPNRRYTRSLSTPNSGRGGGSRPTSSRDTGPTHPGYNRRNARDIRLPEPTPFNPNAPRPHFPWSKRNHRYNRDVSRIIDGGSQEYGYRRVARDIWIPDPTPFNPNAPRPQYPWNPKPDRSGFPIYARSKREANQEMYELGD